LKNAYLRLKKAFQENLKKNKTLKSQIPNLLTCSRALAPITITPLVLTGNLVPALIVGGVLASTDFFDGKLARKWNAESEFGKLIDPIVDKIFSLTLLLTGATLNPLILLNVLPEIAISVNNARAYNAGLEVNSSLIGKAKTWLLSINILLSFIPGLDVLYKMIMTYFTFAVQGITYIDYKDKTIKQIKKANLRKCLEEIKSNDEKQAEKSTKKSKIKTNELVKTRRKQMELLEREKHILTDAQKSKAKILTLKR